MSLILISVEDLVEGWTYTWNTASTPFMMQIFDVPHETRRIANLQDGEKGVYFLYTEEEEWHNNVENVECAEDMHLLDRLPPMVLKAVQERRVLLCIDAADSPLLYLDRLHMFEEHFAKFGVSLSSLVILTCMFQESHHDQVGFYNYSMTLDYMRYMCLRYSVTAPARFTLDAPGMWLRPKKFLYLANASLDRWARTMTMLQLLRHGFDQDGIIGFSPFADKPDMPLIEEWIQDIDVAGPGLPWQQCVYRMLTETFDPDGFKEAAHAWGDTSFWVTTQNYYDSYFSIVAESIFLRAWDGANYTEKSGKAIIQRHPFILQAGYHTLKALHTIGYKSFHPYIDESYDDEPDYVKRFSMVWKEIHRLCSMNQAELHAWYWNLYPILEHNFNHLMDKSSSRLWGMQDFLEERIAAL